MSESTAPSAGAVSIIDGPHAAPGLTAASAAVAAPARGCRVLVLYAHPSPRTSRVNVKLLEAARLIDGVGVEDLYETYPDFYIDVARERALVSGADALVLVFPLQWYACPALLKEWFDAVLHDAWQVDRVKARPNGIARCCWLVTSTGSPAGDFAAGRRHGRALADYLAPIEQTARVCGMNWLEPLVLYSAHDIGSSAVEDHVARFADGLRSLSGAAASITGAANGN